MNTTKQKQLDRALENTAGRFFTLKTKGGELINAQLVSTSPHYLVVKDRNANTYRKLAKTSVLRVSSGRTRFVA